MTTAVHAPVPNAPSLYEQLGGDAVLTRMVEIFYRKVMADARLRPFFEGTDMQRQLHMQKMFLSTIFGGGATYSGQGMRQAHAGLVARGLNDAHFDAVMVHLMATLEELGIKKSLRDWARAITDTMRGDILGH
jgi:hemoglobin